MFLCIVNIAPIGLGNCYGICYAKFCGICIGYMIENRINQNQGAWMKSLFHKVMKVKINFLYFSYRTDWSLTIDSVIHVITLRLLLTWLCFFGDL